MPVETLPFIAMVRRMIAAAGRRVADADEPELAALLAVEHEVAAAVAVAIDGMRARAMYAHEQPRATGTTRQAAQMRWGRTAEKGTHHAA